MSGDAWEKVPEALFANAGISLAARGVYPVLRREVFLVDGQLDEPVELAPMTELAARCGCSLSAFKGYIDELRQAGWLGTIRESKRRPLLYVVRSSKAESNRLSEPESDGRESRNPTDRARDPLQPSDKDQTTATAQPVSATNRPKRSGRRKHLDPDVAAVLADALDLCEHIDGHPLAIILRDVAAADPNLTVKQAHYIRDEFVRALEGNVGNAPGLLYSIAVNVAERERGYNWEPGS